MKKKSAFTFVEVMIAISVFAIGVLAVLRLITQNLVTLDVTQSRTTATLLAKEGIELVYNMRDANREKSLPWDCVLQANLKTGDRNTIDPDHVCMWYFSSGVVDDMVLQISFDPQAYIYALPVSKSSVFAELWSGNRLYYTTGNIAGNDMFWYSSQSLGESNPTFFSRYVLFTGVREGQDILPRDSILKVESHVLYVKGSITGEVVLESFIGNY